MMRHVVDGAHNLSKIYEEGSAMKMMSTKLSTKEHIPSSNI
jgi:hypothetical protein